MVVQAVVAMAHAALLAATTTTSHTKTTTPAVKASSAVLSRWQVELIYVASFAVGAGIAYLRRRRRGIYPWRLHPVLWGMIFVLGLPIIGLPLIAVAWKFTPSTDDPNANPGRRRNVGTKEQWQQQAQANSDDESPARFAPGTYGTSLPPHQKEPRVSGNGSGDSPVEPAGWLSDPSGRHEYRYWDGADWTRHVADHGKRSSDPM
jgi:Protein of unknown function (DUF2510)